MLLGILLFVLPSSHRAYRFNPGCFAVCARPPACGQSRLPPKAGEIREIRTLARPGRENGEEEKEKEEEEAYE